MLTREEIHKIAAVEAGHWWYRGMREICFSLLEPYLPHRSGLTILDIGCGTGGNLSVLSSMGSARGIDLDPLCVDYCRRRGLECRLGSMTDLAEPDGSLDLVTVFDVICQAEPHDTYGILRGIANVVKPGGLFVLREPALAIAAGAHDRAVGGLQRFDRPGLGQALRATGFEPLRITYINSLLFVPIVLRRRIGDLLDSSSVQSDVAPTSAALNAALLAVLRLERTLLRVTNMPAGVSIFSVARKRT